MELQSIKWQWRTKLRIKRHIKQRIILGGSKMFGYVVINDKELDKSDVEIYRSYYCGLCSALGSRFGANAKLSLSYDMTFLVMLLTALYEPSIRVANKRCVVHPAKPHCMRESVVTEYVADMSILMAYYKCDDDWRDEKKVHKKVYRDVLRKHIAKISEMYPRQASMVKMQLEKLSEYERYGETNIDVASTCFGNIIAELCVMKEDEWSDTLRELGFNLGKFVYLMDAFDDLKSDVRKGRYNVLSTHGIDDIHYDLPEVLFNDLMGRCARCFERLPIVEEANILRNILYSGVWIAFERIIAKAKNKENKSQPNEQGISTKIEKNR